MSRYIMFVVVVPLILTVGYARRRSGPESQSLVVRIYPKNHSGKCLVDADTLNVRKGTSDTVTWKTPEGGTFTLAFQGSNNPAMCGNSKSPFSPPDPTSVPPSTTYHLNGATQPDCKYEYTITQKPDSQPCSDPNVIVR